MKKIIVILFAAFLLLNSYSFAAEPSFMNMRDEVFAESKEIKELLGKSKDSIAISSMWDTCLIAISQIDAYFHLLGIFNSVSPEALSPESADYLIKWLAQMRKTNDLNIKLLSETSNIVEAVTQSHMIKMKDFFMRLNVRIDAEVSKINTIKMAVKKK